MTNQFSRPSLLQAHESVSSSTASSASRSRIHSRPQAHQHMHRAKSHKHSHGNIHDRTHDHSHNHDIEHDIEHILSAAESADINSESSNSQTSSDSSSLDLREPIAAVEADAKARRDDNGAPLATHVVQTVSLIQVVDGNGDPIQTQTRYAPPATVVVDSSSGETVGISGPGVTAEVGIGGFLNSLLPGGSSDTTTSTHFSVSTSFGAASTDATLSAHSTVTTGPSTSLFPTLSDASNGTALPGNITIATGNSNSTIRPLLFSAPSSQNSTTSTQSDFRLFSTSSSIMSTTNLPTSTSSSAGSADTTVAEGVAPTTEADDGGELTVQQKQVIGGVIGGIAGVAVLALLVLLVLRYKRKKNAQAAESSDRTGFTTIGDGSSGATGSMAERAGAALAVTAAFAGLAGKRPNRAQEGPPPSSERGFYRVSGRKLPSVLHNGGDGYSDPRQSAMSEQSQYSRDSQMSDAIPPASKPFALGSPMRPISGVPIMRSGPERTPVTTSNPFADPPPSPLQESPSRNVGSRGSPRASGSRFQEGI